MHRTRLALVVTAFFGVFAVAAQGSAIEGGGIDTVFAVRKSTNTNQVDYGILLDADCHPRTDEPVVGYFRRGNGTTRELSLIERSLYGVRGQRVTTSEAGGTVDFRLRSVSDRTIRITARRGPNGCSAHAVTRVGGERSMLTDIYVVVDGPRSVDHIEITGRTVSDSRVVREDIRP